MTTGRSDQLAQNLLLQSAEHVLRILVGAATLAIVVRYLGPSGFGLVSMASAIVLIAMKVATMGIDLIVTRDVNRSEPPISDTLGSALLLRLASSVVSILILAGVVFYLYTHGQTDLSLCLALVAVQLVFFTFDVFEYFYRGILAFRFLSVVRIAALLVSSAAKLLVVWFDLGLFWMAFSYALDVSIIAVLTTLAFFLSSSVTHGLTPRANVSRQYLREGLAYALLAASVYLYGRIDVLMVGAMINDSAAGQYAAGVRVYEMLVPFLLFGMRALFPDTVKLWDEDRDRYWKTYSAVTAGATQLTLVALPWILVTGWFAIPILFGPAFAEAPGVFVIRTLGLIINANAILRASYFVILRQQKLLAITASGALALNIALNLTLIPLYGPLGAAIATLASQLFQHFVSNVFFSESRVLVPIQLGAFQPSWWGQIGGVVRRRIGRS